MWPERWGEKGMHNKCHTSLLLNQKRSMADSLVPALIKASLPESLIEDARCINSSRSMFMRFSLRGIAYPNPAPVLPQFCGRIVAAEPNSKPFASHLRMATGGKDLTASIQPSKKA